MNLYGAIYISFKEAPYISSFIKALYEDEARKFILIG